MTVGSLSASLSPLPSAAPSPSDTSLTLLSAETVAVLERFPRSISSCLSPPYVTAQVTESPGATEAGVPVSKVDVNSAFVSVYVLPPALSVSAKTKFVNVVLPVLVAVTVQLTASPTTAGDCRLETSNCLITVS